MTINTQTWQKLNLRAQTGGKQVSAINEFYKFIPGSFHTFFNFPTTFGVLLAL